MLAFRKVQEKPINLTLGILGTIIPTIHSSVPYAIAFIFL
jgi:hypothetical protein